MKRTPVAKFIDPKHGAVEVWPKRGESSTQAIARVKGRHRRRGDWRRATPPR